jgi:hypothetical protein
MHSEPTHQHRGFPPPTNVDAAPAAHTDAIVEQALAATAAAPPPLVDARERRRSRSRQQAITRAATPRRSTYGGSGGGSPAMRMLVWGMVALLALGGGALATGTVQLGPPGSGPTDVLGGTRRDGAWSYYHDQSWDSGAGAAKWSTDRSRSSDPDEAVLGDTSRWEYDGPYRYGPYGSDGMQRRAGGRESADPLYSQPEPTPDVFRQYGGDLDPSGGQPVGVAPSNMTSPYYDPYAGYSNPYSNRIRMAYGEGLGRGASYAP